MYQESIAQLKGFFRQWRNRPDGLLVVRIVALAGFPMPQGLPMPQEAGARQSPISAEWRLLSPNFHNFISSQPAAARYHAER